MSQPRRCPNCQLAKGLPSYESSGGVVTCPGCRQIFTRRMEARGLFHHLWSQARAAPGYVKRDWMRLQELLNL